LVEAAGAGLLIYVIGSADTLAEVESRGAQGQALARVIEGKLCALVSPVVDPRAIREPDRGELLRYTRRIQELFSRTDVLPMRFGSVLSGEAAVRAELAERQADWLRALERVAGCAEIGVRALVSPNSAPDIPEEKARSGMDYLRARKRRYAAEDSLGEQNGLLAQRLLERVGGLCREHHVETRKTPGGGTLFSYSFLVPRGEVASFRAALAEPLSGASSFSLSVSGPWAPYTFVEASANTTTGPSGNTGFGPIRLE
jgi:hypothetical protein